MAGNDAIGISRGWIKAPIAGRDAGLHLLDNLTAVLLALKFTLSRHDSFDEAAFRRILEFEVEAFDPRFALQERLAQLDVKFSVACEALQIVKDHDVGLAALGIEIAEQCDHARTIHEVAATRYVIGKHGLHLITHGLSMLPATHFLRVKTMSLSRLTGARDTAINDGFGDIGHGRSFPRRAAGGANALARRVLSDGF